MKDTMLLRVLTPEKSLGPAECDSVRLRITDGAQKNEAGAYGIRPGHAPALLSLAEGEVTGFRRGEKVFQCSVAAGFAQVSQDEVTVVAGEK